MELLQQSKDRFKTLLEDSVDLLIMIDAGQRIVYGSRSIEQVLGYKPEELVDKNAFDLIHPDDVSNVLNIFAETLQNLNRIQTLEHHLGHKDGSWRIFESRWKSLTDDTGAVVVLVNSRDITEQKQAQQARLESQRALSTLMSNLPGMVFRCRNDRDWTLEFVSDGCFDLTGYKPADFVQKWISWGTQVIHPDDRKAVWDGVQTALRENRIFQLIYRIITATGEQKWIWEQGRGVFLPDGKLQALEGFITDISDQKRAESALVEKSSHTKMLQEVTVTANEASTLEMCMPKVLERISSIIGWPVGHVYFTGQDDRGELVSTGIWYLKDPERFKTFREVTEATRFTVGVGLPGRVLASKRPEWITDVTRDSNFLRARPGKDIVVKAGLGVPVMMDAKVVAVLEFYSDRVIKPDKPLLEVMVQVGTQLGCVAARERSEKDRQLQMERLSTLHEIGLAITSSLKLQTVLDVLLGKVSLVLPDSASTVRLYNKQTGTLELTDCRNINKKAWLVHELSPPHGPGLNSMVVTTRAPITVCNVCEDPRVADPGFLKGQGLAAFLGIPLTARDHFLGVLGLYTKEEHQWSKEEIEFFTTLAVEAAIVVYNARLYEEVSASRGQLRALSRRLVEVQEKERRHIARELHDEIGQELTALRLKLEMGERLSGEEARASIDEAQRLVEELMRRVRSFSLDLRPAILDDLGLLAALLGHFERYEAQTGVRVDFRQNGIEGRFSSQVETAAYRIVQEALTNVAHYAGVKEVVVQLSATQGTLYIRVEDRGKGFDSRADLSSGVSSGLSGLRGRAELLGGKLVVESQIGGGTQITAELLLVEGTQGVEGG